jgi:hypothetical protein
MIDPNLNDDEKDIEIKVGIKNSKINDKDKDIGVFSEIYILNKWNCV